MGISPESNLIRRGGEANGGPEARTGHAERKGRSGGRQGGEDIGSGAEGRPYVRGGVPTGADERNEGGAKVPGAIKEGSGEGSRGGDQVGELRACDSGGRGGGDRGPGGGVGNADGALTSATGRGADSGADVAGGCGLLGVAWQEGRGGDVSGGRGDWRPNFKAFRKQALLFIGKDRHKEVPKVSECAGRGWRVEQ